MPLLSALKLVPTLTSSCEAVHDGPTATRYEIGAAVAGGNGDGDALGATVCDGVGVEGAVVECGVGVDVGAG